jgi:eukaryotic-like serine/threonine-protein kinase
MVHRDTAAAPPVPTSPQAPHDQGSPEDSSLVGWTLPGGLRVLDRLSSTPEGMLYHGKYLTGTEVVLLILHPQTAEAQAFKRKRLEQATQIQHLYVAATFEVGELPDGSLYVVLEKLVGEPLSNLLGVGRTFAPQDALDLALQVAAGLRAAHQAGFVHGNLSPDTILVTGAVYGRAQVKIINFPLDPAPPISGEAGAKYASPERLDGHPPDERSDVFSLGAVLHHLLTGMPPNPGNVASSIPKFARAVLGTALAPTPDRRFQTVAELEAALSRLVPVAGKPKKPGRVLLLGAVSSGLAVMVAGILLFPGSKWWAASKERPLPLVSTTKPERAVSNSPTTSEAASAPAQARSAAPAPSATRPHVPATPYSPTDSVRSPAVTSADQVPAALPRSVPPAAADADTDRSSETGMVATPPSEPPQPATFEERAQVYLRIGLDEARQQLGRPVHAIEGMTALFLGLARSRFPAYADTMRPVVRSVYIGPNGDLILLDQQRVTPGERVPAATATSWRIGDVMLYVHGEARPEVLRNLVTRVR